MRIFPLTPIKENAVSCYPESKYVNPKYTRLMLLTMLMITGNAQAEPGVSLSHIPYLWGLSAVISVLLCWAIVMVAGRYGYLKTPLKRWSLAFGLFVIFMVFISPVIVVIGSILITGRTM
jgi:hypothetical protein